MKVAIQGERGSYSDCAALQFFGPGMEPVPCEDYTQVFETVRTREADCMVIPMENAVAGSVYPYYDLLLKYSTEYGFRITEELKLLIRHNLIAHPNATLQDIREVRSHPHALDQCIRFLRRNNLRRKQAYDTAGAVMEMLNGTTDIAAIASVQAAKDLSAPILQTNIQDCETENYTRFVVIRPSESTSDLFAAAPVEKVSLVFCIANVSGSLLRNLAPFSTRKGVSIIRIESRPLFGTATSWDMFRRQHEPGKDEGIWDLIYYLDFISPASKVSAVLEHANDLVLSVNGQPALQVLGRYSPGPNVDATGTPWR